MPQRPHRPDEPVDPEEGDFDDLSKMRGPSMRVRIVVLTAAYLLVMSLAVYESRTLIGSILGLEPDQPDGDEDPAIPSYVNDTPNSSAEGQTPVVEYQTLFDEGFEDQDPQVEWQLQNGGTGEVRDGCAYLTIPKKNDDGQSFIASLWDTDANNLRGKWLYVSVEIRLRCSHDNGLLSDVGGGARYWGLEEKYTFPQNMACFSSNPREADDYPTGGEFPWNMYPGYGFRAYTVANGSVVYESLYEIDITEWHNYTISWEPGNLTYLVDGKVVSFSDSSPSVPMHCIINLWNNVGIKEDGTVARMDIEQDVTIQVDHIRFFTTVERFNESSRDVDSRFTHTSKKIEEAELNGIDALVLNQQLDSARRTWGNGYYSHPRTVMALDSLDALVDEVLENHEQVESMLDRAEKAIENALGNIEDRELAIMEGYMDKALEFWDELDCNQTIIYLQKVLDMYPVMDDSNAIS